MRLSIPLILGTGRDGRQSEKAARFVLSEVAARGDLKTELIDVKNYARPVTQRQKDGAGQDALGEIFSAADGFIIVAPEYNRGYPGELKILLDTFTTEYARKPVAVCGVSSGMSGGGRMVEALRIPLIDLKMVPIRNAVLFPYVQNLFAADGTIKDASYRQSVQSMLDELVWYAAALRAARQATAPAA